MKTRMMNFEAFYKQNYKFVYRYFYYRFVDHAIVEDLAQTVFLKFFTKYKEQNSFENEEPVKILFGFCRNIYKDHLSKSGKTKQVEFFDNFNYEESSGESYDSPELQSRRELLAQAMKELNVKVRKVLIYRFMYGMTRDEVAKALMMKSKEVHTYQKRGIKYLRERLK
jgi:RNA polymerase sigma factor (sigma-70 family)